jgi:D-alanyl-D-alanine carboxypeptidase (penicillin-binding protein 5/6)
VLAAGSAALLTSFLLPACAQADDSPKPSDTAATVSTPSTVGGDRLGLSGTQVEPRPGAHAPALPDDLTARSWIVADAETGDVLASVDAHRRLAPASTLKMLFADVVLPKFDKDTTHKVVPSDLAGMGEGSSKVGIKENLTYTVHDLWLGVFLRSGNDAVHVLSAMNGGVEKTVQEMNARAKELNALDTHVVTPDGYDMPDQYSSAYDLTLFARAGMQNPDFREYVSTVRAQFPGEWEKDDDGKDKGEKKRKHFEIQNTNRLLSGDPRGLAPYPGIAGVKNGYTTNAGNTFTGVAERDGHVLFVTVMHPDEGGLEVYKEAASLLDWGFAADGKVAPVGKLVPPDHPQSDPAGGPGKGNSKSGGKNPGGASHASLTGAGASGDGLRDHRRPAGAADADRLRGPPSLAAAVGVGAPSAPGVTYQAPDSSRSSAVSFSSPTLLSLPSCSSSWTSPRPVAVQDAQNSSSLAMKLIHSSRAIGTPKAPYMLFEAMPER